MVVNEVSPAASGKAARVLNKQSLITWWQRESAALQRGMGWWLVAPPALALALLRSVIDSSPGLAEALGKGAVLAATGASAALTATLATAIGAGVRGQSAAKTSKWLFSRASVVLALPLLVALDRPIEAAHPIRTLCLVSAIAGLITHWGYHNLSGWLLRLDRLGTRRRRLYVGLGGCVLLWLAYAWLIGNLAIDNHQAFNTSLRDLGWYVNFFRRSSIGDPLGCTLCNSGNHLTGHFDPIIVLLSPLYWLYPAAELILGLQAVWLGAGAIPLFLVTLRACKRPSVALLLSLVYLAHPALHGINLFEFHSLALIVPLAIWLFYFAQAGRRLGYWLTLALLLSVREDAALVGLCMGVSLLLTKGGSRRQGALTVVVCGLYFFVVKAFIMTTSDLLNTSKEISGYAYYFEELIPRGVKGTPGLLATLLTDPAKVFRVVAKQAKFVYLLHLFLPVLLLPVFAGRHRFLLTYGLLLTLLASRKHVYSIHFHYSSPLLPYIFVLTALALGGVFARGRIGPLRGSRLGYALTLGSLCAGLLCSWKFGAVLSNKSFRGGFRVLDRSPTAKQLATTQWMKEVCARLPKDAVVTAASSYAPHLGGCRILKNFKHWKQAEYVVWPNPTSNKPMSRRLKQEVKRGRLVEAGRKHRARLYRNTKIERPVARRRARATPPKPPN